MKLSGFTGTRALLILFLRRDRFWLPLWILLPAILGMFVAATFSAMADKGMNSVLHEFDKDPLVSAILGPVMSFDLAGAIVWRGASQMALVLAIGSLLTVIRHTRTDEETGRSELIRAYEVGPYASMTAALILTVVGNLVSGVIIALSVIAWEVKQLAHLCLEQPSRLLVFFAGIGTWCSAVGKQRKC